MQKKRSKESDAINAAMRGKMANFFKSDFALVTS